MEVKLKGQVKAEGGTNGVEGKGKVVPLPN
jgi:hypothetical protein